MPLKKSSAAEAKLDKRGKRKTTARASETLYRQMFSEHSAIMLLIESGSGAIVEANQAAANFYGYPVEALQQMNIGQINTLTSAEVAKLRQEVQAGKINYFSIPHRLASGEIREVEVNSVPVEVNGRALLYSIIHDVTERKRAEEALRANETLLRVMADNYPHSYISIIENDLTVGYTAGQEFKKRNLDPQQFIGMALEQVFGEHAPFVRENYLKSFAGEENQFDLFINGQYQVYRTVPLFDKDGGVGRILAVVENITARRQMELALDESRQVAEAIFEFTPDALLMVDENGRIARVNKQAQVMFGYAREELLNQKIDLLIPQRFHSNHARHVAGFFAEPHNRSMGAGLELFAVKRNGREFPVDIILSPLQLNDVSYVTIAVRDITERRQAEAELREMQALIAEKEQFLAATREREHLARDLHDGVGQTLNYMGTQIDLTLGLLQDKNQSGAEQTLSNLKDAAHQINREIREYILGLNEGARPAVRQEFFSTLREYCRRIQQEYQFAINLSLPETLPDVLASAAVEAQLTYVIHEALHNARKHSGAAQASLTIEVDDEIAQAVVEDNGTGWNGAERRKQGRFGMGVMRARAEEVGGTLQVESSPEKGTRITARLPRKLAEENLSRLRILLADDHPLFIDGLRSMLTLRGANIIGIAKDGIEALEMTRALKPDLILMDVNMPRMNGVEAARSIKAEAPDIKIVMLTTSTDEADLFAALSAGAAGYLLKGMHANEFTTLLAEIAYGEALFSSEMAAKMLQVFARPELQISPTQPRDQLAGLNETQHNILNMIAQGLAYKEIGRRLFLTERTVKYHMGEILKRLQLKGRRAAEEYARRRKTG